MKNLEFSCLGIRFPSSTRVPSEERADDRYRRHSNQINRQREYCRYTGPIFLEYRGENVRKWQKYNFGGQNAEWFRSMSITSTESGITHCRVLPLWKSVFFGGIGTGIGEFRRKFVFPKRFSESTWKTAAGYNYSGFYSGAWLIMHDTFLMDVKTLA